MLQCSDLTKSGLRITMFDANCCNQPLRFSKHLNGLNELCVTATTAALTTDCVGEQA